MLRKSVILFIILGLSWFSSSSAQNSTSLSKEQTNNIEAIYLFTFGRNLSEEEQTTILEFYEDLKAKNPEEFDREMQRGQAAANGIQELKKNNPEQHMLVAARESMQQSIYGDQKNVPLSPEMRTLFEKEKGVLSAVPSTGYIYTEEDFEGFFQIGQFILNKAGYSVQLKSPAIASVKDRVAANFPKLSPQQQAGHSQWNVIWLALQNLYDDLTTEQKELFGRGSNYLITLHKVADIRQAPGAFWQDFFVMLAALEQSDNQQVIALLEASPSTPTNKPTEQADDREEYQRALDDWVNGNSSNSDSEDRATSNTELGNTLQAWIDQGRREAADRQQRVEEWEREFNKKLEKMTPMQRAIVNFIGTSAGLRTAGNAGVMFWQ
ncbi:MAG: hypothetical protein AAGF26_19795 [Cyanobacteria bacterium P01_G01_bin.49]